MPNLLAKSENTLINFIKHNSYGNASRQTESDAYKVVEILRDKKSNKEIMLFWKAR